MHRTAAILLAVLVLPAVLPAAHADEPPDTLELAPPRDGDLALARYAWNDTLSGTHPGFNRTIEWRGPVRDFTDGFGTTRRVLTVEVKTEWCACTGNGRHDVEVGTHFIAGRSSAYERGPYWLRDQVKGDTRVHNDSMQFQSYRGGFDPMYALRGRTLVEGETFRVELPPSTWSGERWGWFVFHVEGWVATPEGEPRFLVTAVDRINDRYRLEFDGERPVPVRLTQVRTFGDGRVLAYETTLVSFTSGEGVVLAEPDYVPPDWTTGSAPVPRGTYTRDGPGEAFFDAIPFPDAVATARADPRVSDWLASRPDAYVVAGQGGYGIDGADPYWRIEFAQPESNGHREERIEVEVRPAQPTLLGRFGLVAEPAYVVTDVHDKWDYSRPYGYAFMAGRSLACGAAGEAGAAQRLPDADMARAGRTFEFRVWGNSLSCDVSVRAPLDGHGGNEERWREARVTLNGAGGWVGEHAVRTFSATHQRPPAEEPPLLPVPPLV